MLGWMPIESCYNTKYLQEGQIRIRLTDCSTANKRIKKRLRLNAKMKSASSVGFVHCRRFPPNRVCKQPYQGEYRDDLKGDGKIKGVIGKSDRGRISLTCTRCQPVFSLKQ